MKKLLIPLLIFLSLLTSCDSSNQNNASNINNNSNKETINNNFDTPSNINEVDSQKLINETKDYILNGQQDKPEALKLKWSKSFLNEADLNSLYKDFLSSGTKNDIEAFAKYITENAPILNNWQELFKKDVYDSYQEKIINIKPLEDDLYEGYIIKDGIETPYVIVSSRTGYYHGTSSSLLNENNTSSITSNKEYYIDQLNKLESELKETQDERYSSPVTLDLIENANYEYKIWDDKLNEIYSIIIKELPNDKANELIQEELFWIEMRDEKGDAEAKKNEGGSIAPLNRIMSFIESTKDRCYDLVNNYM